VQKGKFKIVVEHRNGLLSPETVSGYAFNYKDLDFFVYKRNELVTWNATEMKTGAWFSGGRTRKDTIEGAKCLVDIKGVECIKKRISELEEYEK
jgi:hypothetical protein